MFAVRPTLISCFVILIVIVAERYCILLETALELGGAKLNSSSRTQNQEWPKLDRRIQREGLNFQNSYVNSHANSFNNTDSSRVYSSDWPAIGERRNYNHNNYRSQNHSQNQNRPHNQNIYNSNHYNSSIQLEKERWTSPLGRNNTYSSVASNEPYSNNRNYNVQTQQTYFGTIRPIPTGIQFSHIENNGNGNSQYDISANKRANTFQVTDNELRDFSEDLLLKDENNAAKYVRINFQGRTTSRSKVDEAPQPLLSLNKEIHDVPTIAKLKPLYDNYVVEANVNEDYTNQEKQEENAFLKAILATDVMKETRKFLIEKGAISRNEREFEDLLHEMWFHLYPRSRGKVGSSAFEHVFLAEIKRNEVSGLHNWLYFESQEASHNANYLGYLKKIDLGNKGALLKYTFNFHGINKPVGSMFIGTSPEFEMALYSTCFILRADRVCPLKLNGHRFIIRTYTFRYDGKNLIGSAFPEI